MNSRIARTLVLLFLNVAALHAQEPRLINYQGRVTVDGTNFDGPGQFKFAIVNASGATTYWSNDNTSTAGSEPGAAVTLTVTEGAYSVLLGDTTLPNMASIPASALNNAELFLHVWFNDGTNGSQLLTPDQRLEMDCLTTTADAWQKREVVGMPPAARLYHTAVWTGSEMIVWGGQRGGNVLNTGGRYNPAANTWTALNTDGAPSPRYSHTAVWTGSEMIVWGGYDGSINLNTGGRYNPATDSWTAVSTTGAPAGRSEFTGVWTGSEMIVWGGVVSVSSVVNTGGRYNPAGNSWMPVTTMGAAAPRFGHTAVWTGNEMIVWGGVASTSPGGAFLNTGGRYNPSGNSWTAVSATSAPSARRAHTAVWTGSQMIVWGGAPAGPGVLNTGGRYNPATNSWMAITTTGAPAPRGYHTAVWTGSEMIAWGGSGSDRFNNGGRYNPAANRWTAVTTAGAPAGRDSHTAVWTGREMIVWGGLVMFGGSLSLSTDTFSYTPDCEDFRISGAVLDSGNLILSFPTVTGRTYTLWGSDTLAAGTWTNSGLPALTGTGATLTFTIPAPAAGVHKRFFRVHADP